MAVILVVDDESNIRRMLARLLEEEGHTVLQAGSLKEATERFRESAPDLVMLDLALPDGSGLDALETARTHRPELPIVMMSGRASLSDAVRATKLGAFHFIEKPLAPEAVLVTIAGALELLRARELSRVLAAQLDEEADIVGGSHAIAELRQRIEQVAPTDARVLITGESGTGKELVAAALHRASRRADGPLIRVNSAALPRELIESEMFGHEPGAFTGAATPRRGRFELADGGTLFLDEVADLGPEAQSKLLRAIEAGHVERLGAQRPIAVDVRVIAATNRDLTEEVRAGRFRQDLYYRLAVVPIELPPLRARRDDVPLLAAHFLARLRHRTGRAAPVLLPDAIDRLVRYDWPGNVRELGNVCERLALLHAGRTLDAHAIDRVIGAAPANTSPDASLSDRLDAYERTLIVDALNAGGGSVAEAAQRLQTDRGNLYRRMRRLGIER